MAIKVTPEVKFLKDLRNNYMIIEKSAEGEYSSFCIKMLERQEIDGLLALEQKLIDNKSLLYYDITARQSIKNILEKRVLSVDELRSLCMGIIQAVETAYEYLLPENDFILTPDFIFQDLGTGKVFLCLYPGYDFDIKEQMGGLMEFLMNRVDYRDKEAVYLVYRLYAVCKEEGYTLGHLKEALYEKAIIPETVRRMGSGRRAEGAEIREGAEVRQGMAPQHMAAHSRSELGLEVYGSRTAPFIRSVPGKIAQGTKAPGTMAHEVGVQSLTMQGKDLEGLTLEDLAQQEEGIRGLDRPELANQDLASYKKTRYGLDDVGEMTENNMNEAKIPVVLEKLEGEEEISCYSLMTYLMAGGCLLAGLAALLACFAFKIVYNSLGTRLDYSKLAALTIILGCVESYLMSKLFDKKRKITKMVKTKEYIDPRTDFGNSHSSLKQERRSTFIQRVSDRIDRIKLPGRSKQSGIERGFESSIQNRRGIEEICVSFVGDSVSGSVGKENDEADGSSPTSLLNCRVDELTSEELEMNLSAGKQSLDFAEDKPLKIDEPLKIESMPVLKALDSLYYKDIPVASYPFFIGKLKKNVDFHLDSDTVSRYHAKITKEGDSFFITDLNSTNGTFINDELLQTYQKKEIKDGDIIAFANIRYRFVIEPDVEAQEKGLKVL